MRHRNLDLSSVASAPSIKRQGMHQVKQFQFVNVSSSDE